jgi:hypothetical protein
MHDLRRAARANRMLSGAVGAYRRRNHKVFIKDHIRVCFVALPVFSC